MEDIKVLSHTLIINNFDTANKIFKLEETAFFAEKNKIITSNEARDWINDLNNIKNPEKFFASLTYFFVFGIKNY